MMMITTSSFHVRLFVSGILLLSPSLLPKQNNIFSNAYVCDRDEETCRMHLIYKQDGDDSPGTEFLSDFCREKGSLHSIAKLMLLEETSAEAREKMRHVLSLSKSFISQIVSPFWKDKTVGMFEDIDFNMSSMLEGYGLKRLYDVKELSEYRESLSLETTVYEWEMHKMMVSTTCLSIINKEEITAEAINICRGIMPKGRVILNTEQMPHPHKPIQQEKAEFSKVVLNYLKTCMLTPDCIILEYSDLNRSRMEVYFGKELVRSSIVMLPAMIHNRLQKSSFAGSLGSRPMKDRYINGLSIATPTLRRLMWLQNQETTSDLFTGASLSSKSIVMEIIPSSEEFFQAYMYSVSKTCFVVHSYEDQSAGEYHRLSEMGPFGCVPIVESIGDKIAIEIYEECGGVLFVDLAHILPTIIDILAQKGKYNETISVDARRQWWNNQIQWKNILMECL